MSGMYNLSNTELLDAYRIAITLELELEFINLLRQEIARREIKTMEK
jgi:hypothetical protein